MQDVSHRRFRLDEGELRRRGHSLSAIRRFLPKFLLDPDPLPCGKWKRIAINLALKICGWAAVLLLRPRQEQAGSLDPSEVEQVYDREAAGYDAKHHLTTRGRDTHWRRWTAWGVVNLARERYRRIRVLDLCTGTGLAITEIVRQLRHWGLQADIVGLDFNRKMLLEAGRRTRDLLDAGIGSVSTLGAKTSVIRETKTRDTSVEFVRGDAMSLVGESDAEFRRFPHNDLDVVTQMFGIGGINEPLKVFNGVLRVLRQGGRYLLIDMHQPIADQPSEVPTPLGWKKLPVFETLGYFNCVLPIALKRLWGWRDTTLDFYLLSLVTYVDERGESWGFRTLELDMESQRWWLGLPFMPTARITVEKVPISLPERIIREDVLKVILEQLPK
jgi:ubiquinone/menaquinone biosynthesis C-methylase UbiE